MKTAKKNYSFRFQEGVISDIQKIAEKENRTATNLIETVLIKYTKDHERHNRNRDPKKTTEG